MTQRRVRRKVFRNTIDGDHTEERGASLVEFALVLPIFALMLFALIDFGLVFAGFITLRNGVGSGARAASVNYVDPTCVTAPNPMVCTIENRIGRLPGTKASTLTVTIALPVGSDGNSGQVGDPVQVCASADLQSSTGITAPFISGRAIHAVSEIRLEQTPGSWATGLGLSC